MLVIVLSTIFNVNNTIPMIIPYCELPESNVTEVSAIEFIPILNRIGETTKHTVDTIHIAILVLALSLGAPTNTNTKFNTAKTIAK